MNREIKFRGKEAHSGEWVYGAYFTADTTADYRLHFIIPGKKYEGPKSKLETYLTMLRSKLVLVESHTVGQFTGLIDSAGKEVYEFRHCERRRLRPALRSLFQCRRIAYRALPDRILFRNRYRKHLLLPQHPEEMVAAYKPLCRR